MYRKLPMYIMPKIVLEHCHTVSILKDFPSSSAGKESTCREKKNPPAMQGTPVEFLGQEDPLVAQSVKNLPAIRES